MNQSAVDAHGYAGAGRCDARREFVSADDDNAVAVGGPVDLDATRSVRGGGHVGRGRRLDRSASAGTSPMQTPATSTTGHHRRPR
ncbi:hypothetical protein [Gordonia bronchialis]|uniref:hypothetical protein n=1 Tax=Gordonia bronchialis TaxID=2054 RepID=UPI00226DF4AB|nr:hypothetical protein [Gordonia bronchialis]